MRVQRNNPSKLARFIIELCSVFLGVTLAFALNRWNEEKKLRVTEEKILTEIKNGLELDISDTEVNISGHKAGIKAATTFLKLASGKEVQKDSLLISYHTLWRNFISIQNASGYESLKSRGLEVIRNDSLRYQIITLYDFYYEMIEKLEEEYSEMQYTEHYLPEMRPILHRHLMFDENGVLVGVKNRWWLYQSEQKLYFELLNRMIENRRFTIRIYKDIQKRIQLLVSQIDKELAKID
ncbi:DUF6090 family protein [Luteibaculum oceani]|uniref:Uncharacterized protein n=1 Tax=Luteibaculum oceani TaxID=1294296 RepID=A0A5C6UQH0_9FLAO|nr:DUF6090 family protein [Luteibaculum oceani]TXC75239.1 hypothetical protein FRX97_12010 [Luteibaculum oceani]